jgi:hypothetical protein
MPALLLLGLALRLLFVWVGAAAYYPGNPFTHNDTPSFTWSFLNLWYRGVYTFNLHNPEAAFGRLPGYPFFWGAHYLVFGARHVWQAVAYTQCLLDTAAIYLVYATARALTRDVRAAWIAALLYAGYPFVIVWITISSTEALATFLTLLVFWWLATRPATGRNALVAGLLVAVALLVREYLGVLLVPVSFWIFTAAPAGRRQALRLHLLALTGFMLLYSWWPIRNYVFQHRLMPLKTATAGYDRYAEDVGKARQWIYCWTDRADDYLNGIAGTGPMPAIPAEVFASPAEAAQAQALIRRARQCGTGFHAWRYLNTSYLTTNCNQELAAGFEALSESYRRHHPWSYWTHVPLLHLKRAVFRGLVQPRGGGVAQFLFNYRSVLILLSLAGTLLLLRRRQTWPVGFFFAFMYLFLCCVVRHLEVRYLLQADAALLCLAGVPVVWLFDRVRGRQQASSLGRN